MPPARLNRRSRAELAEAARWIANDSSVAARGLRVAVTKALLIIGEYPEVGLIRPELLDEPYRLLSVSGYPYLLVYNAARRPPLVVRIIHGARDLPTVLSDL